MVYGFHVVLYEVLGNCHHGRGMKHVNKSLPILKQAEDRGIPHSLADDSAIQHKGVSGNGSFRGREETAVNSRQGIIIPGHTADGPGPAELVLCHYQTRLDPAIVEIGNDRIDDDRTSLAVLTGHSKICNTTVQLDRARQTRSGKCQHKKQQKHGQFAKGRQRHNNLHYMYSPRKGPKHLELPLPYHKPSNLQ